MTPYFGRSYVGDVAVRQAYRRLRAARRAKLAGKAFAMPPLSRNEVRFTHECGIAVPFMSAVQPSRDGSKVADLAILFTGTCSIY